MSPTTWAFLAYSCSSLLALILLYLSGPKAWYWHVLSIAAAIVLGLIPIPKALNTTPGTIAIGVVFFFLLLWGAAAPFFLKRRRSY